jgi:hypothetical protein
MTKPALVRAFLTLLIVLVIATASAIIIKSNADTEEPAAETAGGFLH